MLVGWNEKVTRFDRVLVADSLHASRRMQRHRSIRRARRAVSRIPAPTQ